MGKRGPAKRREVHTADPNRKNEVLSGRPSGGSPRGATSPGEHVSGHPAAEASIPTHERVAALAYRLWEAHGRPTGTDRADWFEAERLLSAGAR